MSSQRLAVVQAGSTLFNTPKTLERMQAHCEELHRLGVQLAVFPEAYIGGYPKGLDFGARVGTRSTKGREDYQRYWSASIEVPGPEVQQIGAMAKQVNAYLVVGVIERDGSTLYCTALFFDPQGTLLGKHRKLMPTASERLIWGWEMDRPCLYLLRRLEKWERSFVGKTICLPCACACTQKGSNCGAHRPWTNARSGKPPCAISPMKDAALF
jgi:predicted amidohydrolase